jgi:LDH2 family malate/lactate/ureidoglycolate dehydrogenase
VAAVAVRRGFHFGVAGRYVRMAAEAGCVALAMCNTKPVMAAPGGAEKLVGTNPLAIGLPVRGGAPIVFDMATTAGTIGRIRQALAAGEPIPDGWALDADGQPTTDAAAALKGFLLPAAGPKGFGLSFVIDLVSGLLASGGWGPTLGETGGDLSKPYNASYLFIALDIGHFRALEGFLEEARAGVERVHNSRKAAGTARLYVPGEQSAEALATHDRVTIAPPVAAALAKRAEALGVPVPACLLG